MTTKNSLWVGARVCVLIGLGLLARKAFSADSPVPPIVHIIAPDPCASETGGDTATFTAVREGPTNVALTVAYRLGGTASNGVDYHNLPGQVTFLAGARRAPITVTPIDDLIDEGTETIFVELVQPLVWPPPYIVCWPSFAFGHIEDNDTMTNRPPQVRLVNPPDGSVIPGPADIRLVAAAHDPDGRVRTVEFFDGTNSLGIVTNRPSIARPDALLDLGEDLADEFDPAHFPDLADGPNLDPTVIRPGLFRLLWEDVPPGAHVLTAVATDNFGASTRSGPVHIRVTEPPLQPVVTVKATDPSASEGPRLNSAVDTLSPERIDPATFTVHRSGPLALPLTVYYRLGGTALNGVDYRELPHSVTIRQGVRSAEVVVEPIDDALVEGPEKVVLLIVPPICPAIFPPPYDCYLVGREDEATAVIHDNDLAPSNRPPVVEIVRPEDGDIFLAPVNLTLVAAARDYDGRVVSVEFFDGTNSLGVVPNNAAVISPTRPPFSLVWSNVPPGRHVLVAKATDDDGAMARSRPVEIKVVERTEPVVVSIEATDPEAAEGGNVISPGGTTSVVNTATFTVKRTGSTARSLLVYYGISGSASNGVDYDALTGRLIIPDGSSAATIVVRPVDDRLFEGTEMVGIALEPSRCLSANTSPIDCYVVGTNNRAQASIRDNDPSPNTNQPPKIALVRPEDGSVFTAPAEVVLVAEARDADGFVRTVEFFANGSSLGVVSNSLSTTGAVEQLFRLVWSGVPAGAYALNAKATDNRGAMTTSDVVHIRVIEASVLPVVTIEAVDPYAAEGELTPRAFDVGDGNVAFIGTPIALLPDQAVFVVKRDRGTNIDLVVHYVLEGTARNGTDYRLLSGEVKIPRGSYGARIVVDPIDDNLVEGTETVIATLQPIACPRVIPPPPECYLVGEPGRAIAFIRDNDFANQLPKVEIVVPADGDTFVAPADIEIGVYARDPDGWVERVEFFAGTNKIGEDGIIFIQPPPPGQLQRFSMTWSNVPPGSYVLTVRATDNRGGMTRSEPVGIKVTDPCRIPVVTLAVRDAVASEPFLDPRVLLPVPDTATFVVKRTCRTNESLTVFYRLGGSASNGVDYLFLRGHVTIAAGSETADIVIDPIDDKIVEGTETVRIELERPVCIATDPPPPGCYLVGQTASGVAYIRDNDEAPNFPPRIALLNPPEGSVFPAPADILLVAEAADSDGWVVTVEFFAGTNSLGIVTNHPRVLDPVLGVNALNAGGIAGVVHLEPASPLDPVIRPINPFQLKWENVPPGRYSLTAKATDNRGASTRTEATEITVIGRPDRPVVTISAPDPKAFEGCRNSTADCIDAATFTVKRSGPTNEPLRVYYRIGGTASNGVDYREIPNVVVIAAGDRTADVIIEALDDTRVEGQESVVLSLVESPACLLDIFPPSPDCYEIGRARVARAVIYDNDTPPNQPPEVTWVEPEDDQVFTAPADIKLVAKAGDADGRVVLVEFFEGTNKVGEATGPSTDDYFRARWIQVPAGAYVLTAVATDDDGAQGASEPVEIRVVERTPPTVVNIFAIDPSAREINPVLAVVPDPATFRVTREGETNRALTVYLRIGGTAENAVDYEFIRAHATIAAGAFSTDITVNVIDDQRCEGDESVLIGILPAFAAAETPLPVEGYIVGSNDLARAVIHDDDVCPTNVPPRVVMVEPQDGDVFRAPADILLVAKAGDSDGRVVLVEFYAGTTKVGMATGPSVDGYYRSRWIQVPAGSYILTAVATDDDGAASRSEPVRIRVIEARPFPVVCIEATDDIGSENGDEAVFVVKRDGRTNDALLVFYTLSGTASNNVDYEFLRGHVTIPAGAFAARIVVNPIDDTLVEGTESVIASLSPSPCAVIFSTDPACYIVGRCARAAAYIRDNDSQANVPPGVAILFPSEGSVFTAPADIEITAVALDPDGWVTQIEFLEGTNVIGGLAILVSEPPPPGELQVFHFNWSPVPAGRYVLTARVTDNRGAVTTSGPIHVNVRGDDELPVVTVVARDPVGSEPDPRVASPVLDTATFVVHRTGGLPLPLLVRYRLDGTARNGVDYAGLTGEVLIPAGEDSAPIVIRPLDDEEIEGTESIIVALEQPACLNLDPRPSGCYRVGEPGRAIAFLRDNDTERNQAPRAAITSPRPGQVFETPAHIPVMVLARDPDGWVQTVEFFEGTNKIGEASIYFIVAPPPGELQEFTIRWNNVPPGHYRLTAKATDQLGASGWSAPVDIVVVEPAPIPTVGVVAVDAFAREGTPLNPATFRVRRTGPTNAPLTVFYALSGTASNGLDYSALPGSVTIPAGRRTARITVTPVDDRRPEPIETVIVRVLDAALYNAGHPARAGAIIVDNDHPEPITVRLSDRSFHLRADGMAGGCCRLEASSNLRDWESLGVCGPDTGSAHFVDPEADAMSARFYRLIPDVCEEDD